LRALKQVIKKVFMQKRVLKFILIATVFFYSPIQSKAWGLLGHRIIGEIADSYLTPKARTAIKKILGNESIAMASNWADFIKSDTGYKNIEPWHYIDFSNDMDYKELQKYLQKDTAADAYTAIKFLMKELKKKNLPDVKKLTYLRLLIHIAGDIHQPLHVSKIGDMGGNDIKVTWFGQPTNLHRIWDSQLIENQQLSYTEYTKAINHATLNQRKIWLKQPISQWIYDSYQLSDQLRKEIKEPNPKLGYLYNYQHLQTLNNQLLKGGIHVSVLLNEIFG
jgi:nuclease S1